MEEERRSGFSGKLGFVLAAAGSAVGLGNIWRFPYLAAKCGGGIFILVYLLLVVFVGFSISLTETAIGRKTGKSAIGAFKALNRSTGWFGIIPAVVPAIILPYYSVVGGWVVRYLGTYIIGKGAALTPDDAFGHFIAQPVLPIICFLVYFAINVLVVWTGVQKGIEKASKILMPALVVLCVGTAAYVLTLPGAAKGLRYLFVPNLSQFSAKTVLSAMSQMFFSLSLAMGVMITYGAYMKKDIAMDKAIIQVAGFDTAIAIIAAMMVVPAVFSFSGGDPAALGKGAGLMFVTLPKVFASFGGGSVIGVVFFLLVLFAALTSSISLMEAMVSELMEIFGVDRGKACVYVTIYSFVLGALASLGFGPLEMVKIFGFTIFDFCDFFSNNVLMPIGALLTCVFAAWVIRPKALIDEVALSSEFKTRKVYSVVLKYVAPVIIAAVLVSSVLEGLKVISY